MLSGETKTCFLITLHTYLLYLFIEERLITLLQAFITCIALFSGSLKKKKSVLLLLVIFVENEYLYHKLYSF